jgi:hypothetical protein
MANDEAAGGGPAHSNISTPKALTYANLEAHQQGMTQASETAVQKWLTESCDRPPGGPTAESWTRLVAEDNLAAEIEAALHSGDRK